MVAYSIITMNNNLYENGHSLGIPFEKPSVISCHAVPSHTIYRRDWSITQSRYRRWSMISINQCQVMKYARVVFRVVKSDPG